MKKRKRVEEKSGDITAKTVEFCASPERLTKFLLKINFSLMLVNDEQK